MAQEYQQIVVEPKPFVKWAGGKRQLLAELEKNFPKQFGTYFEPFLGGGAVLFDLLAKKPNIKCSVSDLNSDLVLAYVTIRDKLGRLIESLENHSKNYHKDSTNYYYEVRKQEPKSQIEKVSRLLFLNKTCFNGLYRVNSKGKFNVPLGRYTNPNIVNRENLITASKFLQSEKIKISCRDFESILKDAKKGDFVYFDPPYQPVSDTANFTSYTHRDFTEDDLQRLADLANQLNSKGAHVLLSNSNTKIVKKIFSSKKWKVKEIAVNRAINSNSQKRTGHKEILIKNY
uniref:site-specific DNA-methyltransferase (adenine-specific) n=1 Tax=uncultured marine thaumarchaeote KM3_37_D10 TaxID=1456137 RepID=A0A075H6D8_9ARCH|nr:DNA adenine methylase (dam) [uncultured marine thaumarchaeote KM3_37_D10]